MDLTKYFLNEDVLIPPELSQQYLAVKKQIIDKQTKKDMLMKQINQIDSEISILQRNILAIESKAVLGQTTTQQPAENTKPVVQSTTQPAAKPAQTQAPVAKESLLQNTNGTTQIRLLDEWIIENLQIDGDVKDEHEEINEEDNEDNEDTNDILTYTDEEEPSDDFIFAIRIIDDGEDEEIIAKIYKDDIRNYWLARVVKGSEEPLQSMEFDSYLDKVAIINHLGEMYDEIEEIPMEEYQELLDDKEENDSKYNKE